MEQLTSNVFGIALVFEGGSMRAAYTSGLALKLLEEQVWFDHVYGISAGSSNAVNYVSRDQWRTRVAFTDFMGNPNVGSVKTFLQGKGIFNAHYIYQECAQPGGLAPFDIDTFLANPATVTIPAFDRDSGENLYFTKDQMRSIEDVMVRVRASSTLPVLMPPPTVDGRVCYDGGFNDGGGVPLDRIIADGLPRMLIVRTRPKGYRKPRSGGWADFYFWRKPRMAAAIKRRWHEYNETCDRIEALEASGQVKVFYSEDIDIEGTERDVANLARNQRLGHDQAQRQWDDIMAFVSRCQG